MMFFAIFLSLDHKFSLTSNTMIACNNIVEVNKTHEIKFGVPKFGFNGQNWAQN